VHNNGTRKAVSDFHACVPTWRAPHIKGTVCKNGTMFYKGTNGKLYVPHLYDAMFKAIKGTVMDKSYKGVNPGLKY
jgi:hypothetical protein